MTNEDIAAIRRIVAETIAAAPDLEDGITVTYDAAKNVATVTMPAWQPLIEMTLIVEDKAGAT